MADVAITISGHDWQLGELDELEPGMVVSIGGRARLLTAVTPAPGGWQLETACGEVFPIPRVVRSEGDEQVRMLIPVLRGFHLGL